MFEVFRDVRDFFLSLYQWFKPLEEKKYSDEIAVLYDQYQSQKSWFDKTASGWSNYSLMSKLAIIGAVSVFSGLASMAFGSTFLIAIPAFLLSITVHSLFVSHEKSRFRAWLSVSESSRSLSEDLKESVRFYNEATEGLQAELEKHEVINQERQEVVTRFDAQIQTTESALAKLSTQTDALSDSTSELSETTASFKNSVKSFQEAGDVFGDAIDKSQQNLNSLDKAVDSISSSSEALKKSQAQLSSAANRYHHFVSSKTSGVDSAKEYDETDALIDFLDKEADQTDVLIGQGSTLH